MTLDKVDQRVLDDIAEYGWSAISVFPTENDPGPYFTYTVGMVEFDHPDLIVCGMHPMTAHAVLNAAWYAIKAGSRLEVDTFAERVLQGFPVAILEVLDPIGDPAPMSMCNHLYGQVDGVQIVWPDAAGKFPWDSGFDEKFRERQPLLGIWRGP